MHKPRAQLQCCHQCSPSKEQQKERHYSQEKRSRNENEANPCRERKDIRFGSDGDPLLERIEEQGKMKRSKEKGMTIARPFGLEEGEKRRGKSRQEPAGSWQEEVG